MGVWGVRALESDRGEDAHWSFASYAKDQDTVNMSDVIDFFIEEGFLSQDSAETQEVYGYGALLLAEVLQEYAMDGMHFISYTADSGDEVEKELTEIDYTEEDLDFIIARLQAMITPHYQEHELYSFWESSSSFEEWQDHIESLLADLEDMK